MEKRISFILYLLLFAIVSCKNDTTKSNFDFNGKIRSITVINKGYDQGQKLKKEVVITDKEKINSVIKILEKSYVPKEEIIGSNHGYIRATLINDKKEEFIFENFYSVRNGIIILFQGSNKYKNDAFAEIIYGFLYDDMRIEDLVGKEGRDLIEKVNDSIN